MSELQNTAKKYAGTRTVATPRLKRVASADDVAAAEPAGTTSFRGTTTVMGRGHSPKG